jgi:hypothetical protein
MSNDLAQKIAKLEAIEDIKKLKSRYAQACDDGYNPVTMRTIFTEDATWDAGPAFGRHEGIDAICEFFAEVSSSISWALHYMMAPEIEVADDVKSGTGTWYIWMPFTAVGEDGDQAAWVGGIYKDEYRLEPDGWRISNLNADLQIMSPYEDGWVKTPMMAGG